jgi:diguanylate cyclase (GGDEF)-like protein
MIRFAWGMALERRLRLVANIWAVLTLLWLPVDILILPGKLAIIFTVARIFLAAAYLFIGVGRPRSKYKALEEQLSLGRVFILFCLQLGFIGFAGSMIKAELLALVATGFVQGKWVIAALASAYIDQPLLLGSMIGLFPLFLVQLLPLVLLIVAGAITLTWVIPMGGVFSEQLGLLWMTAVTSTVGGLSALVQNNLLMEVSSAAYRDHLTGALTRHVGDELGATEIERCRRHRFFCSVGFIDLDHFKEVNDRWGHAVGDKQLCQLTEALQHGLRQSDSIIRWGGEEFVVLLPMTSKAIAVQLLERLRQQGLGHRPDGELQTVSVGVAEFTADGEPDWPALVALADKRMYKAKEAGRDRIVSDGS